MLNAISVEKYAFITEQTKALEKAKSELAERFRLELHPGEGAPGYIHEIRLSAIPCIKPKLDYRRVLVDKIGEQAVLQYEAEAAKGLPDMGTPRLLVVNIVPANPSLLGKVGTMYKGFKKELFG
jgi:hypothetical protein